MDMEPRLLRSLFFIGLGQGLKVVWPILSVLLGGIVLLGAAVAVLEDWRLFDGIYFAFVTSLTIGYGDLVPKRTVSRVIAIGIGLLGVLLIGLVAAIAVRAMEGMSSHRRPD
jgi:Ion channel